MAYKSEDVRLSWQLETVPGSLPSLPTTDVAVTQGCVADIVGVHKSTVSDWVRGGVLRSRERQPLLAIQNDVLREFHNVHGTARGRYFERWLEEVSARVGNVSADLAKLESARSTHGWKWGDIKEAGQLTTVTELSAAYVLPTETIRALLDAHFIGPKAKAHRGENLYGPQSLHPAFLAAVTAARKALNAPTTLRDPPYRDQGYQPPEPAPNPFWDEEQAAAMGPRRPPPPISKKELSALRKQLRALEDYRSARRTDDIITNVRKSCALVTIDMRNQDEDQGIANGQRWSASSSNSASNVRRDAEPDQAVRRLQCPSVDLAAFVQDRRNAVSNAANTGASPIR
jgi:hypothetical protein